MGDRGAGTRLGTDVAWTTLTSALVIGGNALVAAVLARRAVEIFGFYSLARRIGATALPLLCLGLTLGLAKFLAAAESDEERASYIRATVLVAGLIALLGTALIGATGDQVSVWLFGSVDLRMLWSVWLYCMGLVALSLGYAMYRGMLKQGRANLTTILGAVAAPLAVVLLLPKETPASVLVGSVGLLILAVGLASLAPWLGPWRVGWNSGVGLWATARELVGFSSARVPGGVAQGLIMTTGPVVAARAGETLASSYLLGALAFAQVGAASLQAFSIVLLPRVSQMSSLGDKEGISRVASQFISILVVASVAGIPIGWVAASELVRLWLGPDFAPAVPAVQIVLLAIPWYVSYSVLTSVTDGAIRAPLSSYAAIAAFVLTAAVSLNVDPSNVRLLATAFFLGQLLAGGWIMAAVIFRFRPRLAWRSVAVGLLLGLVGAWVFEAVSAQLHSAMLSSLLAVAAFLVAFLLALVFSPQWLGIKGRVQSILGRS